MTLIWKLCLSCRVGGETLSKAQDLANESIRQIVTSPLKSINTEQARQLVMDADLEPLELLCRVSSIAAIGRMDYDKIDEILATCKREDGYRALDKNCQTFTREIWSKCDYKFRKVRNGKQMAFRARYGYYMLLRLLVIPAVTSTLCSMK